MRWLFALVLVLLPVVAGAEETCQADACFTEGMRFLDGNDVKRDEVRAAVLLEKACDAQVMAGCRELGRLRLHRRDPLPRGLMQVACSGGDLQACALLGVVLLEGLGGTPLEEQRGEGNFRHVCNRRLGLKECRGLADSKGAVHRHQLHAIACAMQVAEGCLAKAVDHDAGHGTPRDDEAALEHERLACRLNSADGCYLAAMRLRGRKTIDQPLVTELMTRACSLGEKRGCQP
jgi:uncharacterized protein